MKFLERTFNMVRKSISSIMKDGDVYTCAINNKDKILLSRIYNLEPLRERADSLENIFNNSIAIIPQYEFAGEYRARMDVFLRIARELHYFPFAGKNGSIYISTLSHKEGNIESDYCHIDSLFKKTFGCGLTLSKITNADCYSIFEQRVNDAYKFYVEEHGDWIERFMVRLGDDISRDSYTVFLRQRIMASIFDDSPICYPVLPPAKTAAWRQMRENKKYSFPVLRGVSQEILEKIFYKYIYVYEQYAIQGIVEAQVGDTVVDVGAFIGDTAYYFSKKVGDKGKVLSFEITPDSIAFAKENMRINQCHNVYIIPYALSDKTGYLSLSRNDTDASSNSLMEKTASPQVLAGTVKTITLDEYCQDSQEKIDFIKADIEGAEMSMLRGATHTIAASAPVCAICLYHRQNDFWEIPQYLEELCPEYTFWFRCEAEPVLFAKRAR